MTLADLRKVSIRKNLRIRFPLSNGMECVLNEHGIAQVPALRGVPGINLEHELASAAEFTVEPAVSDGKGNVRRCTPAEMAALAKDAPAAAAGHEEHEE